MSWSLSHVCVCEVQEGRQQSADSPGWRPGLRIINFSAEENWLLVFSVGIGIPRTAFPSPQCVLSPHFLSDPPTPLRSVVSLTLSQYERGHLNVLQRGEDVMMSAPLWLFH